MGWCVITNWPYGVVLCTAVRAAQQPLAVQIASNYIAAQQLYRALYIAAQQLYSMQYNGAQPHYITSYSGAQPHREG